MALAGAQRSRGKEPCAQPGASAKGGVARQALSYFLRRQLLCGLGNSLFSQTLRRNLKEGPSAWDPGATLRSTRPLGPRGSGLLD